MVHATRPRILAILLLCFCINIAVAERWAVHLHRRDGPTTPSTTVPDVSTSQSNKPSETGSNSGGNGGSTTQDSGAKSATITPTSNSTSSASATATPVSITPITSNINGPAPTSAIILNSTGYNYTLTPDQLPITPVVSPGFAVGGVILMLTGAVYTLIGIKNKLLQISLSAAYLASLAVTVLILYVMNPPVSDAVQGAYVVAIVMTGLILGGAATIFAEMTEGLGCLLGGFCLSMWLLVLKPGGLLTSTSGKSIFIAVFTIAGFSTSFSRYTRPYALIILVSFAGATTLVLGIDCFSRAGLKEFWAYLWDLNTNLFPLGATSYPVTRGIRVELAAIIIIFLAGVVSQMKLWKIIKKRRAQRAAERLNNERNMEQEEENVGRRIEHTNAEERQRWEAVYGDKDADKPVRPPNRDSGVGDMESQKKGPASTVPSVKGEENIEMTDMSPLTQTTGAGLVMTNKDGGPITIRVARDVEPTPDVDEFGIPAAKSPKLASPRNSIYQIPEEEKMWVVGADGEARLERRASKQHSQRSSKVPPKVVPLPFKVPDSDVADDRSSVFTFADEDTAAPKRCSKHLSAGSMLLRKLSQRSHASLSSPRSPSPSKNSRNFTINEGPSTEDIIPREAIEEDRGTSVAATMDGLSDDEDMRSIRSSVHQAPDTTEVAGPPQASETVPLKDAEEQVASPEHAQDSALEKTIREQSCKITGEVVHDVKSEDEAKESVDDGLPSLTTSTDPKDIDAFILAESKAEKQKKATSIVSAIGSKPASITKDRLPAQLSKVVMSYRTNEWAKHLSMAEQPEVEELQLAEYPAEDQTTTIDETPVPVNVDELQQTAANATPAPAPSRSVSQSSNHPHAPNRSNSAMTKQAAAPPILERPESFHNPYSQDALNRSLSQQSLVSQKTMSLSAVPRGFRSVSSPSIPHSIVESPTEGECPSHSLNVPSTSKFSSPTIPYGAPGTLIGKRDSIIRQKYNLQPALASTPEIPYYFSPAGSSSHQTSYTQFPSVPASVRAESDAGSMYNYPNANAIMHDEDDNNMSLSARRQLIRQSSLHQISALIPPPLQNSPAPFDSHQPKRNPSGPSPMAREQQLASWRASVQYDLQASGLPQSTIERQRSQLWQERQQEEQRRALEERRRGERDSAFDERMRRGDMLDAHREALRKMQASANKHA